MTSVTRRAKDNTLICQPDMPAFYENPAYRISELYLIQANYPALQHTDWYLWYKPDASRITENMVAGFRIRPRQTADRIISHALNAA